ncbi:MAG: hypothetical protein ACREGI_05730 [Candidatus Levyibacteriota bacterium]
MSNTNDPLQDTVSYYHGDKVRRLSLAGALVMVITMPFFIHRLPVSVYGAIFIIILVGFFAGLTNPKQFWSSLFDVLASLFAFCMFEYYAVTVYLEHSITDSFAWVNELLAIIFFLAFYFSIKTVRGFFVERKIS